MGFMPHKDVTGDNIEPGGQELAPGTHHVEVTAAADKDVDQDKPYTFIELTCRASRDPAQLNRVHREQINWHVTGYEGLEKQNHQQIVLFAVQTGVMTREQIKQRIAAGQALTFDWDKAIHKHLIVEIGTRQSKDKTKTYINVKPGQIYTLDDPRVKDAPKDTEAEQLAAAAEVF